MHTIPTSVFLAKMHNVMNREDADRKRILRSYEIISMYLQTYHDIRQEAIRQGRENDNYMARLSNKCITRAAITMIRMLHPNEKEEGEEG